jgi:hypothetical protein
LTTSCRFSETTIRSGQRISPRTYCLSPLRRDAYSMFQKKEDGAINVLFQP